MQKWGEVERHKLKAVELNRGREEMDPSVVCEAVVTLTTFRFLTLKRYTFKALNRYSKC